MTETIDTTHWAFDAFEAAGYPRETLFDPGQVKTHDFADREWRALVWTGHGIEMFDISFEDVVEADWAPAGVAVEYGNRSTQQPIGFADDTGLLNSPDRMPTREAFKADSSMTITFLWPRDAERSFPEFTKEEAVEVLGYWGSEGWMPRCTVEAIMDAWSIEGLSESYFQDDPDVEGEEIARAASIPGQVCKGAFGERHAADSNISGHKKVRRQEFYRNLDALRERYGIDDE